MNAVEVIGFRLQTKTDAAVARQTTKTDVLGADFDADAIDPILVVSIGATTVNPLIAGRCEDHAAVTSAGTDAATNTIFPVDVLKTLGRIAFGPDEYRAEGNIDTSHTADE